MSAARYDLFIEQGVDFSFNFRWKTGDPASVVDIQSYTAAMQARTEFEEPTTLFSLSLGSGITINVDDYFVISLTDTQTSALDWTEGKKFTVLNETTGLTRDWYRLGVYDFEATSAGGQTTRLLYGYVYVSPEVTR